MKLAHYKCLGCGFEFSQKSYNVYSTEGKFMGKSFATDCPLCGHVYLKWMNCKEIIK